MNFTCFSMVLITTVAMFFWSENYFPQNLFNNRAFFIGLFYFLISGFFYSIILGSLIKILQFMGPHDESKVNSDPIAVYKESIKLSFFVILKISVLFGGGLLIFEHFSEATLYLVFGLVVGLTLVTLLALFTKNSINKDSYF